MCALVGIVNILGSQINSDEKKPNAQFQIGLKNGFCIKLFNTYFSTWT